MDKENQLDAKEEAPYLVNTIMNGKLVLVDLNIAISSGDLGMEFQKSAGDKGRLSQLNTRETKKKPGRIVGTFIKGVLTKVDLDSIEAREE